MTGFDTKQTEVKDATVTQRFENSEDSQGEVLETRYAGMDPGSVIVART